jgi:putative peptidoglycan lipid II flippase
MPHPIDPGDAGVPRERGHATLGASVRTVSLLTIGSRIGGLVRDVVTVRLFGDTWIGSAFAAAWTAPNLFRRLFGEGALAAAFLPEYTALERDDPEAARRFASRAMRWLVGVTGALTVLVEVLVLLLLFLLPPHQERDLSLRLILVMMPFMPMVCATAILASMLQTHGRFAPGAAAPILLNGGLVAAAAPFLFSSDPDAVLAAYVLSAATLVTGVLQVLWTLAALRPFVRWTRQIAGTGGPLRRMLRRFGPVVIGLGTIQINSAIDTAIAMWPIWAEGFTFLGHASPMDQRSNAILTYTQRLYQFPLGVFGIAVATAAFPMLARAAKQTGTFMDTLRRAMRLSLFIGVPASVGLVLVRHDLIGVVYTGGNGFSEDGARRSAAVLVGYAVAVWAYSLNHVCTRAFYARGDTRTPMKVAMGAVGLNLALNLALIWSLREAGLAWATGASAVVQCAVLLWIMARRVHKDVVDRQTLAAVARIASMSAGMAAAVWGTLWMLGGEPRWGTGLWMWGLLRLLAGVGVGGGVYLALAALWRSDELRMLVGARRGRLGPDAAPP